MFCKFFQIWRNYPTNDAKIASVNMLNFIKNQQKCPKVENVNGNNERAKQLFL